MWAVKVPFDGIYLYLTEGDSKFNLRVRTFETREKAEDYASLWGDDCIVLEYKNESVDDMEVCPGRV